MRLLVVSQYFWPENFRINDLASELIRRGHEVTVLTGKPNYPDGKIFSEFAECPEKFSSYQGVCIVRVPLWPRGNSRLSLFFNYMSYAINATLCGILYFRNAQFDAIFVFEPSPVTVGLPAVALRRLRGWPVAFWVLDQWPETLSAVGGIKSKIVLSWVGRLVSYIYNRCDLVLAQSKSLIPLIGKYCNDQEKIKYFPSWAESDYSKDTSEIAPEVPTRNGCFNIMFAGNIGESQDFPAILDAAELLKTNEDIRWLIVGDGRMADWVKDEVTRRGLQENFIMLGRYPIGRMPSFYRHAGVLLVTLKSDPIFSLTLPGKVQSYLAAGIPVLGMLDGEGARVINTAQAGFSCAAGDAKALAEVVLHMSLLTDADRLAMGKRGQIYSQREFDRDLLVGKLEAWLMSLLRKQHMK